MTNTQLRKQEQELNYKIAMKSGRLKELLEEAEVLKKEINEHLEERSNLGEEM